MSDADEVGYEQKGRLAYITIDRPQGTLGARSSRPVRENLSHELASYLRDLIVSGEVSVGTHLRVGVLAEAFGVSLTPMREALISLQREGIVLLQPRRGFSVSPLNRDDIENLFDMQAYVAGRLAARAATRLTDEGLRILDQLQEKNEAAILKRDAEMIEHYNYELHRHINLAAQADKLTWMLRLLVRYVPRKFYGDVGNWREPNPRFHRSILNALHKHDPQSAEEHMRAHILDAGNSLMKHLEHAGHSAEVSEPPSPDVSNKDLSYITQKIRSEFTSPASTPVKAGTSWQISDAYGRH
jgi:DNA-binding GntR family transcriptional regulator